MIDFLSQEIFYISFTGKRDWSTGEGGRAGGQVDKFSL